MRFIFLAKQSNSGNGGGPQVPAGNVSACKSSFHLSSILQKCHYRYNAFNSLLLRVTIILQTSSLFTIGSNDMFFLGTLCKRDTCKMLVNSC